MRIIKKIFLYAVKKILSKVNYFFLINAKII